MKTVLFEQLNHIGLITLNRPEALNALNLNTLTELGELLENIEQNKELRAIVIQGAGKAFCVGADLKERRTLTEDEVRRNVRKIRDVFDQLERLPQPTIAALHGYAFGGGLELALACDLRYVEQDTQLGLTEVSLGIIPGAGGTVRLTQLVGKAKAKELILLAERIHAEQALKLGVCNEVAQESQSVFKLAFEKAEEIAKLAPLAVIQAKHAINKGYETDTQAAIDIEAKAYETLIPTEDRVEALAAFNEKRRPVFRGR
ncbi:enoyl-CoA hydratase-related protein [Bacillus horti]|uniref:Enoyl-CoA hydratase/carnithine racemase n=1 Tax=Caldalkalibacillus horti TaxID=77523 RepID=A0ABT9W0S4_9BACI|nr:enoyl-CoA hydratase-related protein [Bacillus horti]MDQ0166700.1 enoyl-CoA hydratase/carnithine racemase [Bacillus horti]